MFFEEPMDVVLHDTKPVGIGGWGIVNGRLRK